MLPLTKSGEILNHAAELNIPTVLTHKVNRGYGGALRTGLASAKTPYVLTMDADGQHRVADIETLLSVREDTDADLVIGSRKDETASFSDAYRTMGKSIIRSVAKLLMEVPVQDLNSGMKLYITEFGQKYLPLCPDSMAFSEVMTLIFLQKKHLVVETPIETKVRLTGESTINTMTAFNTVIQIINIVMFFNPLRIFLPVGLITILVGMLWALPFLLSGKGLSTAALLFITTGMISIMLGLIAEQLAQLRKKDF